jgi:hypothetical protein
MQALKKMDGAVLSDVKQREFTDSFDLLCAQ